MEYLNYPKQKEYTEKKIRRFTKWLFVFAISLIVGCIVISILLSLIFLISRKNG